MLGLIVVPYAGTWIETSLNNSAESSDKVVPYAGTWIETNEGKEISLNPGDVVPYAGTWIETTPLAKTVPAVLIKPFPWSMPII